jgi:hypothetical protein
MFFRLSKPDTILPDTKMYCLVAKASFDRKHEYVLRNTPLHEAVLANDDAKVIALLSDKRESKNINEPSLMNTPLTLALKQGNTQIAKCILARAKELELNINHKDSRGLTALDWACMLRNDEVISMILSMPGLILPKDSYAKALYYQPVEVTIFTNFLKEMAESNAMDIAENRGFSHLRILKQEPYSDMVYFMRDICVNRGIMQAKDFPPERGASHVWFYRCFKKGYEAFCAERNQIPVNQELLTAMLSQESLTVWQQKMATSTSLGNTETLTDMEEDHHRANSTASAR